LGLKAQNKEISKMKFVGRVVTLSMLMTFGLNQQVLAQIYPTLNTVKVHVNVNQDSVTGYFFYKVEIENGENSKGKIQRLDIDIHHDSSTSALDTTGLKFDKGNGNYEEQQFRRAYPRIVNRVDPVTAWRLPTHWETVWGTLRVISIGSIKVPLPPGQSIDSIVLMSRGLPSIRHFMAVPEFQDDLLFPSISEVDNSDSLVQAVDSIRLLVRYKGETIAPTAPPLTFLATAWCDTLSYFAAYAQSLSWIPSPSVADKYFSYFNSAKASLRVDNIAAARTTLNQVLVDVNIDSTSNLTSEAYALIRYNTEYLLSQLPTNPAPGLAVRLVNSGGTALTSGSLQYYEASWKDAVNNNDGTFTVNTSQSNVSLRMTYAYGSQQKNNVPVNGGPVTFQTANTQVKLQNSQGTAIDTASVQYYAGAWRSLGTTSNGVASMELLPGNYSFRMTYAYGTDDKQQDVGVNPVVVFQTVNVAVQLKNSQGTMIDQGTVQYYAGSWRELGTTSNGVATKELLPNNYSFRMTYAFASKDMQQNIGTNPSVVFSTVNATVQLKNSLGNLIDSGTVQYYAGAWRDFGTTTNGASTKELLPNSYSFRMTYESVSNDKAQDVGINNTIGFSTVLCTVKVSDVQGQLVNSALVSYYSGAWQQIGLTVNGQVTKELLPANLTFRAKLGTSQRDKAQNTATNSLVEITLP
jgi:hypothetical protein